MFETDCACYFESVQVKEWLGELKSSRAAEAKGSQQLQVLQDKVVELQQELAAEVAAAAAGAQQIKELNELNVKLSGHNNQQQVTLNNAVPQRRKQFVTPAAEDPLLGGTEEGRQRAEGGAREGEPGEPVLRLARLNRIAVSQPPPGARTGAG